MSSIYYHSTVISRPMKAYVVNNDSISLRIESYSFDDAEKYDKVGFDLILNEDETLKFNIKFYKDFVEVENYNIIDKLVNSSYNKNKIKDICYDLIKLFDKINYNSYLILVIGTDGHYKDKALKIKFKAFIINNKLNNYDNLVEYELDIVDENL